MVWVLTPFCFRVQLDLRWWFQHMAHAHALVQARHAVYGAPHPGHLRPSTARPRSSGSTVHRRPGTGPAAESPHRGAFRNPKIVTHGILHSLALPEYLLSEFAKVLITMCCWCFGGDDVFHRFLYLNSVFPFSHFKEILVATCCGQKGNSCAVWCWLHHLANKVDPKCLAHETC